MAAKKKDSKDVKKRAVAFLNWELKTKKGVVIKSDKGFPIYQNPEYPNAKEDMLIAAARSTENGVAEVMMKVRIVLNTQSEEPANIEIKDIFNL